MIRKAYRTTWNPQVILRSTLELDTSTLNFPILALRLADNDDTIWIPYDKVNRMIFAEKVPTVETAMEPLRTTQKRPVGRPRKQ